MYQELFEMYWKNKRLNSLKMFNLSYYEIKLSFQKNLFGKKLTNPPPPFENWILWTQIQVEWQYACTLFYLFKVPDVWPQGKGIVVDSDRRQAMSHRLKQSAHA